MTPSDFVYKHCFKSGMKLGLSDRDAGEVASEGLRMFKQGKLKKATDVFKWAEQQAKTKRKLTK